MPPDRSLKMIAQPSMKKTNWRAGVAMATEQPGFVSCSLGEKTFIFVFPHIFSVIVFFCCSCCSANPNHGPLSCTLAHLHGRSFTEKQERSVARSSLWHIAHVTLAHAAHCAVDAHRHLRSCSLHLHCRCRCHTITPDSSTSTVNSGMTFLYPYLIINSESCFAKHAAS